MKAADALALAGVLVLGSGFDSSALAQQETLQRFAEPPQAVSRCLSEQAQGQGMETRSTEPSEGQHTVTVYADRDAKQEVGVFELREAGSGSTVHFNPTGKNEKADDVRSLLRNC